MLPVLLDLKIVKIYTFGVFLVLAFFWGSYLLWKNIRLTSYKEDEVFDGLFMSIAGALFFGRLLYVILNFGDFGFSILKFILVNGYPGISLIGAIGGGIFVFFLHSWIHKTSFLEKADYFISPLFLALGFGMLGAFFSGVEAGSKTTFPVAVKYVGFDGLRHITGFYEAVLFFAAAYVSYRILFNIRRERYPKGFLFYVFVWFTSLILALFDGMKAQHLVIGGRSLNLYASLILLLTFSFYFVYYFRSLLGSSMKHVRLVVSTYGHKTHQRIAKTVRRKTQNTSPADTKTD